MQRLLYHPYGAVIESQSAGINAQPYKFGGKEDEPMHEAGLYDFHARHLNYRDVPAFTSPDPLAEKYYEMSPYMAMAGNPVRYVDPTGMDWFQEDESGATYWENSSLDFVERDGQRYRNIGKEYFSDSFGVTIHYKQNEAVVFYEGASFSEAEEPDLSLIEE